MPRHQRRRRLSAVSLNASFTQDTAQSNQSSVEASDLDATFVDLGENDDNAERSKVRKRPRRKSMVPIITPSRSVRRSASNRSRRASPSPYGHIVSGGVRRKQYSNDELVDIYKDCIIKAQKGKINQMNAWALHLVDNIKEITDMNHSNNAKGDTNNEFARASHTIDAASKIYGYRVDSVHNKTYKILGSIHQTANDGNNNLGADDEATAERKRKRKQRNRNVGKTTLCEADKQYKLNEKLKNLCVEVDPLFHKTASCFDDGGAKGLLMNTLYVQNGCDIVFDSSTKIEQNEDITKNGIKVDNEQICNQDAIKKECEWTTQLFTQSFGDFDGFTQQIDTTSPDFDVSTQTKPDNFTIDVKWLQSTSICPLLNLFNRQIDNISNHIPAPESSPQKGGMEDDTDSHSMFAGDNNAMYDNDDNDVIMNMPDFTIGGDDDLNAQDLFHEPLLTQAVAPLHNNAIQPQLILMNANGADGNIEYVAGHNNGAMIGAMGVQPDLNNSMGFAFNDSHQIVSNLQQEQQDLNHSTLHRSGIYKRGAMNLGAMNDMISKLENADFENLTSFFDTKKHGNWAGPDQWYHRRYLMTLKQGNKTAAAAAKGVSHANSASASVSRAGTVDVVKNVKRKKKQQRFDFMSIASGNLIDEKEFDEPQRSFNTLTQAVLDKNRKTYHTLPKDLQIKPDMFIKLFHRENYSVWKHWLRQHQLRMMKRKDDNNNSGVALENAVGYENGDMMMSHEEPQFLAQQAAAMAVIDDGAMMDDDADAFQYNYNNALDTSHFVPNMMGDDDAAANYFDFNLNGYDLVDIDADKKLEKIQVEFSTTAKKVNVRKLKLKLWDKIDKTLMVKMEKNKENVQKESNVSKSSNNEEDDDIDMQNSNEDEVSKDDAVTFQDTLDSLPNNISATISVHMCFICLLHLANEKELQFVPKEGKESDSLVQSNFEIQYKNDESAFEKDAQKINPIMVLGMQ